MILVEGKSVYGDICIGKLHVFQIKKNIIKKYKLENTAQELERFEAAKTQAVGELEGLYDKALSEVGEANAAIFEVHEMLLEDPDYLESIQNIITVNQLNAEYAIGVTADNFAEMFAAMDDEYMRGRAADIKDVSERLLHILEGGSGNEKILSESSIILADDLTPSETIQLDKSKVLGFIMRHGSANSHTAILARSMGIPAIVNTGIDLKEEYNGKLAVLDGFDGKAYIDPEADLLEQMRERQKESIARKEMLKSLKGKENVTLDGRKIKVFANIGNLSDLALAMENDAGGIGLFRSEFLYLENNDYPTEEQQFKVYKQVAENMAGREVVIRTLDIGADKQADYFKLDKEENPALGYRAIRICLTQTDIFKTQLRALYRASMYGNIAIMYPMVISMEEVRQIKKLVQEVKAELEQEGIPFKADVSSGIMIETPAAALISEELAKEVDFFSVGTNDLTQYTLAIDRQNPKLDSFYNPHHKAVLKLIRMAAESIHAEGKWIGICGELGADTELTEEFLLMGIDELSVSPSMVLDVRNHIRGLDLSII